MKIYRIAEKNIPHYLDLIPTDFHSLIYREEFVPYGLLDVKEGKATPAGLIILSASEPDVISIEWLFVAEEYQGQGCGDQLVSFAMDMAQKCKCSRVQLKTYRPEGLDLTAPEDGMYSVDDWFLERGFFRRFTSGIDKVFYFDSIKKDLVFKEPPKCDDVISFSELSQDLMNKQLERLKKTYGYSFGKSIDMDKSVAIIKNSKVAMAFTVRRFENTFVPTDIYTSAKTWNKTDAIKMVLAFMRKAYNETGDNGFLHLTCNEDDPLFAITGLFEDGKAVTATFLQASAYSYEEEIEEIKYELAADKEYQKGLDAIPETAEIVEIEYFSGVQI